MPLAGESGPSTHWLVERLLEDSRRQKKKAEHDIRVAMSAETIVAGSVSRDQGTTVNVQLDAVTQDFGGKAAEAVGTRTRTIDAVELTERYTLLGELGSGGMGVVLRVRDLLLNRVLAMKVIHCHLLEGDSHLQRFVQEGQVCAQLQHPNILPVHDLGVLKSGHVFFTMTEIKGSSFDSHIRSVHEGSSETGWEEGADGWNLHRLVSVFYDACKAISHAHENGVVHRDLKPANIMIGPFGGVLVVDWGLAKVIGSSDLEEGVETVRSESSAHATVVGSIYGTPGFVPPELASGKQRETSTKADIYALGVTLYEVLRGQPAYSGRDVHDVLRKVVESPPEPFTTGSGETLSEEDAEVTSTLEIDPVSCRGAPLPRPLVSVCQRAMARNPDERFNSVSEMIEAVGNWLDGSQRREKALGLVMAAAAYDEEIQELEEEAESLLADAVDVAERTLPWQVDGEKLSGWAKEDRARDHQNAALLRRTQQVQLFRAALSHKEDLVEAHRALAAHYQEAHQAAEEAGDVADAQQAEFILREHVQALPANSAERRRYLRYLEGTGSLTLRTNPPAAEVEIRPFELRERRLQLGSKASLGASPVLRSPLEMGTYLVEIKKPGFHTTRYPVCNQRLEDNDGRDPSGDEVSIELLPEGTLGPDDCYVPAGWCRLGGDSRTPNSLEATRVWVDGFVIRRFPVTHREYLLFLNDLVEQHGPESALAHVPREQSSSVDELGAMAYLRRDDGSFALPADPQRQICWPDQPVTMIQWRSARAYCEWLSLRTGLPWRLPMEFEWEKAARGVDGRFYPWGDEFDPSWACMKDSHPGDVLMQEVDTFPFDESVYGVRGTAGNTRDWCLDRFRESGPELKQGRLVLPSAEDLADKGFKATRGGSYGNSASRSRSADRDWWFPERSYIGRGLRVAWGLADWGGTER